MQDVDGSDVSLQAMELGLCTACPISPAELSTDGGGQPLSRTPWGTNSVAIIVLFGFLSAALLCV